MLPHSSLAPRGKAEEGGLSGAASDFEALERLRRLAFAESVPAPHIQLELDLPPAETQEALDFDQAEELDSDESEDE